MSYRNPKNTYVSSQPAFNNLTNTIVGAAQSVADKKSKFLEDEKIKGEKLAMAGQGASSKYIRDSIGSNDVGDQNQRGAVAAYFKGKGKQVAELKMATTGVNRKCEVDGNCEELEGRLANLQNGPVVIKGFMENILDQLDYKDIKNFDASQNPDLIAAANIMSGSTGFNEDQGYSYKIEDAGDGSYNLIFKGEAFEGGEKTINSAQLENITREGGSLFETTQNASDQQNDVMQNTEIIKNASYDEKSGAFLGGGSFEAADFVKIPPTKDDYISSQDPKTGIITTRGVFDENIVKKRIKGGVAQALESNFGLGESNNKPNDGQIRTYWNKVLSNKDWAKNSINSYDEQELRDVFGDDESSVEQLKTRWGDVFTNWTTKDNLSKDQIIVFKEMYLKQQAIGVTKALQNHPSNIIDGIDVTSLESGDDILAGL
tara:strand:- start:6451 stop:7740 length:1290 start_codon:yes stop_codon:yes gene_type:complete